jgi:antitoxin (DNA-binding transcriptional repressor) of toxin-antitoxin stability system
MPRTVILKEARAPYTLSLDEAALGQETVILERKGRSVAAVVPFAEYEAFTAWRQRCEEEESRHYTLPPALIWRRRMFGSS